MEGSPWLERAEQLLGRPRNIPWEAGEGLPGAALTQGLHLSLGTVQGIHGIPDGGGDVPEGDTAIGGSTAQEVSPKREVFRET